MQILLQNIPSLCSITNVSKVGNEDSENIYIYVIIHRALTAFKFATAVGDICHLISMYTIITEKRYHEK